ncbi:MAG: endonuclease/exonuclease/phosphatase family protein [Solirubrobacteraceae bacterium]
MSLRRLALAALLTSLLVPAAAPAATAKARPDVTVMSRNLYLGADIIKLASAKTLADEMAQAKALHATVDQTNFPLRAKRIAAEIARTKPDVIGLQEVARYFKGAPGVHDGVKDATTPLYDWLALLQAQIRARRMHYKVAARQDELDIEVPSDDGYDLRLTLGNAVLIRTGKTEKVKLVKGLKGVFTDQLSVPLADGQSVGLSRGWAGLDGTVAGTRFRFLAPHGEAYSDAITTQQFKELLRVAAKSRKTPTIIAGDFNSDPGAGGAKAGGYKATIDAGFRDTARRQATCCQTETLTNPVSELSQWIDHIVVRPRATVLSRRVVGNRPAERIGGLWPSDHAGIVARVRLH